MDQYRVHWHCYQSGTCSWLVSGDTLTLAVLGIYLVGLVLGLLTVRLVMG